MIRSEKQLQAARQQLALLRRQSGGPGTQAKVPKALLRAAKGQTAELAADLEREIEEYEQLQQTRELHIRSLEDLRVAPLRYRIAAHLTIEAFAQIIGVHSRQIARYESDEYRNVTWETLFKILEKLGVIIEGKVELNRKVIPRSSPRLPGL
jgi:DNA-binding XRE family transcriptional regulator